MESHLKMSVRGILVLPNTHPAVASMSILIFASILWRRLYLISPVDSTLRLLLVLLDLRFLCSPNIPVSHCVAFKDAVLPTAEIPEVLAVTAANMQQYDLPGHLQPRIDA